MNRGEERMYKRIKKGVLLAIVTLLFAVMLTACGKEKFDMDRFEVKLKYGYGDMLRMSCYAPFYIDVTNHGKDFSGTVQLIIPNEGGNTLYEKEISIPAGTTKSVAFAGEIENAIHNVNIRIGEDAEHIVWKKLFQVKVEDEREDINIGILSDDFTALGYMDRQSFPLYPSYKTRIYELNADRFPDDAHALEMLDVILVSDFSTDILTDNQIAALRLWNSDGGVLIAGTGSTYNKTLSKLNHDFFEVQPGALKKYSTKFGLSMRQGVNSLPQETYEEKSPYSDAAYEEMFATLFMEQTEEMENLFLEQFLTYYGYTQEEYENDSDGYVKDNFYWYCFEEYYYEYYLYGVYLEEQENKAKEQGELPFVEADVLELTVDSDVILPNFEAEIENSSKTFPLGYTLPMGNGYIFLSTVDFTKNPLSRYDGNDDLFVYIMQDLIGGTKILNGSNGDYYFDSFVGGLADLTGGAQVPPLLIYGLLFFLYLVAIIALYVVFNKKRKVARLWILYPLVSLAFAILIYCTGFSTRLLRPYLNVVSVLELQNQVVSKTSLLGITVPNDNRYEVSLSKQYAISNGEITSHSYYWDESDCDYDRYTTSFGSGLDDNRIVIENETALSCRSFVLRNTYHTEKGIEIKHTELNRYEVTNNYGCDLEAAYIYAGGALYYIGGIKSGETCIVTDPEVVSVYRIEEKVTEYYREKNALGILGGISLGSLSPHYNAYNNGICGIKASSDYINKIESMYYSMYSLDLNSTNMRIFAAVPKKPEKGIYQEESNYRENCVDVLCMIEDDAITK